MEKKFGKVLGKIWVGLKDIDWLGIFIDKEIYGKEGEFFQHRRDGYKAIHVICHSNHYGYFLEISEFHSGSRQWVIRIPEGKARKGWLNSALVC